MSFFNSRANRVMLYALGSAIAVHFLGWDAAWLDRICQLIEIVAAANIAKIGLEDAGARLGGFVPPESNLINKMPR